MLMSISHDEAKRNAWEVLCGPVDWEKAKNLEAQANEPFFDPSDPEREMTRATDPALQATLDNGWVPELGGPDAVTPLVEAVEKARAEQGMGSLDEGEGF
jgi:hypothetical protein